MAVHLVAVVAVVVEATAVVLPEVLVLHPPQVQLVATIPQRQERRALAVPGGRLTVRQARLVLAAAAVRAARQPGVPVVLALRAKIGIALTVVVVVVVVDQRIIQPAQAQA